MKSWKRMSSGRYVDLSNMTKEDIHIEDIVPSLNYLYRFTGHHGHNKPLTVAQHSILCLRLAEMAGEGPQVRLCTLTHDFAEAYIGDVATPLKRIMGKHWKMFANPIEHLVNEVLSPDGNDPDMEIRVKKYDSMALDIERRCMWNQRGKDKWPEPLGNYGNLEDKLKLFHSVQGYGNVTQLELFYKDLWKECYG